MCFLQSQSLAQLSKVRQLSNTVRSAKTTPLVVILPWLNAKPKHVEKYKEFYHQKGLIA